MVYLVAAGAAVLLVLLPLARARLSAPPASSGTSTSDHDPHFDFYVFSMSFQPEFCYAHKRENFDGCNHPNDEWRGALTIHVSCVVLWNLLLCNFGRAFCCSCKAMPNVTLCNYLFGAGRHTIHVG
jgi:hypothetical protein